MLYSSANQQLLESNQSTHYENSFTNGSQHVPTTKSTLFTVSKYERWALVNSCIMHCMYSNMAKGTSQAGAVSSKKIKPVALAIVKLH